MSPRGVATVILLVILDKSTSFPKMKPGGKMKLESFPLNGTEIESAYHEEAPAINKHQSKEALYLNHKKGESDVHDLSKTHVWLSTTKCTANVREYTPRPKPPEEEQNQNGDKHEENNDNSEAKEESGDERTEAGSDADHDTDNTTGDNGNDGNPTVNSDDSDDNIIEGSGATAEPELVFDSKETTKRIPKAPYTPAEGRTPADHFVDDP